MKRSTEDDYRRRILRAQRLIEENLDAPLSPSALAEAACFSLHHFHRIFRAQLGETVMQHVRRLRIERAARRMKTSEVRLLELALEAGYESHEAFTRAFVDRFGVPPSEYREQPSVRLAAWEERRPERPTTEVRVKHYPEMRVACMRSRGSYAAVGELWKKMWDWLHAQKIPLELYGLCPDDPAVTEEDKLRFDACVVVGRDFVPDENVSLATIPGGTYAVGLHIGPYDRLSETYLEVIGRWFPISGYELEPAAAVVERYVNDPSCAPSSELRTEVRVKIAD